MEGERGADEFCRCDGNGWGDSKLERRTKTWTGREDGSLGPEESVEEGKVEGPVLGWGYKKFCNRESWYQRKSEEK